MGALPAGVDWAQVNWVAYLWGCLQNPFHPGLDPNLGVEQALGVLRMQLEGTPYAAKMADAALTILADGEPEARKLLQIDLKGAPDVPARVAAIVEKWRGGPLEDCSSRLIANARDAERLVPPGSLHDVLRGR